MNYSAFSLSLCISLSAFLVLWKLAERERESGFGEAGVAILCTHIPVIVLPEETGLGSRPHVLLSSSTFLLQVQSGVSALHLSPPGRRTRSAPCLGLCLPSPSDGPACRRHRRLIPEQQAWAGIALAFRRHFSLGCASVKDAWWVSPALRSFALPPPHPHPPREKAYLLFCEANSFFCPHCLLWCCELEEAWGVGVGTWEVCLGGEAQKIGVRVWKRGVQLGELLLFELGKWFFKGWRGRTASDLLWGRVPGEDFSSSEKCGFFSGFLRCRVSSVYRKCSCVRRVFGWWQEPVERAFLQRLFISEKVKAALELQDVFSLVLRCHGANNWNWLTERKISPYALGKLPWSWKCICAHFPCKIVCLEPGALLWVLLAKALLMAEADLG